jgi:hypothetical protein
MSNDDARDVEPLTPETPSLEEEEEVQDTPIGDLPGAVISEADLKMKEVFGDYVHQNDGSHLDGGIKEDGAWQEQWRKLIALPSQRYDAPNGAVGRRFVNILALDLEEFRTLFGFPNGGTAEVKGGEDCFSHQAKNHHAVGRVGS